MGVLRYVGRPLVLSTSGHCLYKIIMAKVTSAHYQGIYSILVCAGDPGLEYHRWDALLYIKNLKVGQDCGLSYLMYGEQLYILLWL